MNKICTSCSISKPDSEFYYKKKEKRFSSWCSNCFNQYQVAKWKQRKLDAIDYLGGKCADCSGVFHQNVYDFHHLRDKDVVWNKLRLRSWVKITKELDKCVLLCANCHRLRHV